ncbi:MAG: dynamin family protein, partial [Myxococcota bacterium]
EHVQQAQNFLQKPTFVVGFAGGFNAGKSMLINALLGEHLLKDGAAPTTSSVTRITACAPERERMVIHFFTPAQFEALFQRYYDDFLSLYQEQFQRKPHSKEAHKELLEDIKDLREQLEQAEWNTKIRSLDSFYELILSSINHPNILSPDPVVETLSRKNLLYYTTKTDQSVSPLVREVQLEIHHPMLAEGSELIDLPGLGSPDPRDEEITVAALRGDPQSGKRECDAVVHVMDSLSPFRAGEDRLFQIYKRVWGDSFAKRVFLVISRWGKLEQETSEEMITVAQTLKRVVERYHIEGNKVFVVDGRIGTQHATHPEHERAEQRAHEEERLAPLYDALHKCLMPNGTDLFEITVQAHVDGNIPALREALRYYLAEHKEYLHLADALHMLETQTTQLQHAMQATFPPLDQVHDDESHFIEECKRDIEHQLKTLRARVRTDVRSFFQNTLHDQVLPQDMGNLFQGFYQATS